MLHVYNTLSRRKEPLKTRDPGHVRLYVCGMTVYDYCHLGHARMLVSFDVVQRWLRASGYRVSYVRNITDIDDKIIRRAVETRQRMHEVTAFFIQAMHADERALNVQTPNAEPRATQHVGRMLAIIGRLEDRGLAYRTQEGDVNYAVRRFPGYGKLSGKTLDDLRAGERVSVSGGKRDSLDFVLWKAAKPQEPEESRWQSPYGWGRPGWHIECSAMSETLLGLPLDIHGGGPDLKFPHHENEIAQSEGAFGTTLASLWMHCGPLMVDAEKMSKSLGNFRTIRQTIAVDSQAAEQSADYTWNPREAEMLRFLIVRNHYRSVQHYAPDHLLDAQNALDRLYQTLHNIPARSISIDWQHTEAAAFRQAMNDDFNTAAAVAVLFTLANQANREQCTQTSSLLRALGGILGLLQTDPAHYLQSPTRYQRNTRAPTVSLDAAEIEAQIAARAQAKQARDFSLADHIRNTLAQAGITLEDKPGGITQWRRT